MERRGISHETRRNHPSTPAREHKDCSNLGQPGVTLEKHLQMLLNCTTCQPTALGSKTASFCKALALDRRQGWPGKSLQAVTSSLRSLAWE